VPAGAGPFVAVAAGDRFSLALTDRATVVAWGDIGPSHYPVPALNAGLKAIAAGATHALAARSPGAAAVPTPGPSAAHGARLLPNAPNPFNPSTTICFELEAAAPVRLGVYDVRGRLVRLLAEGPFAAGRHQVRWDGHDGAGRALAAGVYLCRLEAGQARAARALSLVK
jgi:hypothetical protein